jgi:restriction system protein
MTEAPNTVQAPWFPTYAELAHAIRAFDGEPVKRVRDTITANLEQMGTPQSPVDWSDPDTWINERLSGELQSFARKVWDISGKTLNPHYLRGCYLFINNMKLLDVANGIYQKNERGTRFLANDNTIIRELDAAVGMPRLLSLVAERSPCRRSDILPAWSDYLKAVSSITKTSYFGHTLQKRLVNLVERELVSRDGNAYSITDLGLAWLKQFSDLSQPQDGAIPSPKRTTVAEAAKAHNDEQLIKLRERLMKLEPRDFENFIKALLGAMDYDDVFVTKYSTQECLFPVMRPSGISAYYLCLADRR